MKKYVTVFCLLFVIDTLAYTVYGQTIQIVTEEYPPYNYEENGNIAGVSTDVVNAVLKEVKSKARINLYPWPRAYDMALNNENTMIYSISRTVEREHLFKWVGEVAPANNFLFSLKTRTDIKVHTLDDARKYKIGTVLDDVADLYLIKKGFVAGKNIERAPNYELNMKKLLGKRLDLWFSAELVANYLLTKNGYIPNETVSKVFLMEEISQVGLYMAFSKKTSDAIVQQYKTAIEKIKNDGTYSIILKKYN